ncbi:integrase catalytic domain-containing protein [Trichonephila clavipes]|nr:integrase catalytic domain-containing protein [Trichonephila clavipes]
MVEECFQEDFLKAWNRSATSEASTDAKERLNNLMTLLKAETEGEERINLAMAVFGLGVNENRQSFKKKVRDFPMKKIPSAANLLITASKEVKKGCVFCTEKPSSRDCFQAQKMSLAERHNILREKQCCFACLTPKHTARSWLQVTTHKLKKENLFKEYGDVFKEWKREGIIEEVPKEELKSVSHYLTHRHVVKVNSTTKIRLVFNASSKQKGAVSLNDCLEKGLNLIELIPSMLARFRLHRFGVLAHIRKAFLQISLYQQDRNFLRFLWHSEEGELIHYRHCRVVFGVSSSPFLLGSTIQYHLEKKLEEAKQGRWEYSECIVQKLMSNFYVYNCLASVQTQSELDRFIDVATEIIAERKFDLRGWEYSNPSDLIASPTNVLGMIWDRHCDTLSLNIPDLRELMEEVITKRNILAASHKVFDPLAITGPVLLLPKLWLQSLWKSQIGWDQEVDIKTSQYFLKWLKELKYLKHVQVPRWLHCDSRFQHISLHFFCDARKLAYSAVVFLRVNIGSTLHIQLVQSKTRIAPCGKKETTIARLELLGAAISARLSTNVLKEFPTDNVYFWKDSTTVLAWLKREESWGVFVYNRVQEIRKLTPVKAWRHVPGSLNPADCPSRGCSAKAALQLEMVGRSQLIASFVSRMAY